MKNTGKSFEDAVARFVKTLAPGATVTQNYFGRDKDTGERQQMDVWVETTLHGHWPLTFLISCKDYKRVLHAGDIRTFCRELEDAGAAAGIIYSSRGFNENALKKAKVNGIGCCRLFQNDPAEIPEALSVRTFLCRSICIWPAVRFPTADWGEKPWCEFLKEIVIAEGEARSVIDFLEQLYRYGESAEGRDVSPGRVFPEPWRTELEVLHQPSSTVLTLVATGAWRRYRGKIEAHLANGSYCLSNELFAGSLTTPVFEPWGETPGPSWEEITENLSDPEGLRLTIVQVHAEGLREALLKGLADKRLKDSLAVLEQYKTPAA